MSEIASSSPESEAEPSTKSRAYLYFGLFVALLLISQAFIWLAWEPAFGDSLKNLITYSMGIFFLLVTAVWAMTMLPASWKTRIIVALAALAPLAVAAAVIRDVEFSGDMAIAVSYRWDEPDSAARRAAAPAPISLDDLRTVPETLPSDYAEYRGTLRDGHVLAGGADLRRPPTETWRRAVGSGWAGMAVVGDLVVTLEQIGGDEAIVCYDAETGDELWRDSYAASFDEAMGGPGPRSTPTVSGDRVYAYGAQGHLTCVALATGEQIWQVDTLAKFGLSNLTWATSGSPLVRGGELYINTGSTNDGGLTCFNADSGDVIWRASEAAWDAEGANAAGYASPMFATIGGVEQLLMFDAEALRGHDISSGRELWNFPFTNEALVNVAQPIVFGDGRVFIAASYSVGCEMVQLSTNDAESWSVTSVWKEPRLMRCKFTSPVLHDGYLYGLNEGILECLDPTDGKRKWKKGRYGHGQLLLADGVLIVMAEDGRVVTIDPNPEGLAVLTETPVLTEGTRNWNPPSLSRGRLFVRNDEEMVRLDFPSGSTEAAASTDEPGAVGNESTSE